MLTAHPGGSPHGETARQGCASLSLSEDGQRALYRMRTLIVTGMIDRRLLINYRIEAEVAAKLLPDPFEPLTVNGYAMGGICLIRLTEERPSFMPPAFGLTSENAAHRIAVTWREEGRRMIGVYIPRRDTSSRLNTWVGGRLYPGTHHLATFKVRESDTYLQVNMEGQDGWVRVAVAGERTDQWPETSVFSSLKEASAFFQQGIIGYSPGIGGACLEGLELHCVDWHAEALNAELVNSSYFDDQALFPAGSASFDHALLMRDIPHQWRCREAMPLAVSELA